MCDVCERALEEYLKIVNKAEGEAYEELKEIICQCKDKEVEK